MFVGDSSWSKVVQTKRSEKSERDLSTIERQYDFWVASGGVTVHWSVFDAFSRSVLPPITPL